MLIGVLVLAVLAGTGAVAIVVSTQILKESAHTSLENQAVLGADLIGGLVQSQLDILQELANRARTRTMNLDAQQANLLPDIDNHGYMDLALVFPDGRAHYIKDNTTSDLADRDYIRKALAGEQAISDVLISRVIGKPVVMFAVPITDGGTKVVGALIARKDGSSLTEMSKNIKLGKTGYSYMVNGAGVFIAHSDSNLVLNQFNPLTEAAKDPALKSLADAISTAQKSQTGYLSYSYEGKALEAGFAPVAGYSWTVFVATEQSELLAGIKRLTTLITLFSAVFVVIGIIAAYLIAISISKPIGKVAATLKDISEGEGDLTRTIDTKANNEIGELAHYFNLTLAKIRTMVVSIKTRAAALADIGGELASNMTQTASAINEISANIQSLKQQTDSQSASVTETNTAMAQITGNIEKLNGNVDKQSASVSQSSSAVEEMLANIQSVTGTLTRNVENVESLSSASEVGRSGLQDVASDIQQIARDSEGLLEINAVMENIASQTNLLSMNAAIEAAHAGEAGKGFAVVADEIRKLAENSSEQSKTISSVLKKIKDSIDKITRSTDAVLNKFEAIDSGVRTVSDQEENIRNAMEEQGQGSQQILESVSRLNELTRQVKDGAVEMLEGSRGVIGESENLSHSTAALTQGINEMATGASQINVAVHRVNEISGQNKENIDVLVKEVSRFKVE
jgi:methyl-accepting chemotaxis protein